METLFRRELVVSAELGVSAVVLQYDAVTRCYTLYLGSDFLRYMDHRFISVPQDRMCSIDANAKNFRVIMCSGNMKCKIATSTPKQAADLMGLINEAYDMATEHYVNVRKG